MFEDLHWFGFTWQEGPDIGGPFAPYTQSQRREHYVSAFEKLRAGGFIYPCTCSRQDVLRALQAPHAGEDEPLYPGTCRPKPGANLKVQSETPGTPQTTNRVNWRFRVPEDEYVSFIDGRYGPQRFLAGQDFGDFVVWRHDGVPSYQLAVVVDDVAMRITEVVRGEDLLRSTARQLLLYQALGWTPPAFFHCPLLTDSTGARLAKRHDALSLRTLRAKGVTPEQLRQRLKTNIER
jgi:glutamyl-tRNA synthetase